ncbi:MAG: acetate--CoA ligase family protein [Acidimicrobiales bacterium]
MSLDPPLRDLAPLFAPASVAFVGASSEPTSLAGRAFEAIRQHEFAGHLYPVNPSRDEIAGLRCYPSVSALPESVDLAVIMVSAPLVASVIDDCGRAGVRAAYIITSGFGEAATDVARQADGALRAAIARWPALVVAGPNGEGIYDLTTDFTFTFSPVADYTRGLPSRPEAGNVAIISQSGGVGFGLFSLGLDRGIGFSRVVSTGNEVALDILDYVAHSLDCPSTDVIILFVEGFHDPGRLRSIAAIARERNKALIVMKIGRSESAQQAAQSHTGHLSGPAHLYSALFRHEGIIEVRDANEALDVASVLARWRGPVGRRVGIVTGSGGAGVWLADVLAEAGLSVPSLPESEQAQLRTQLPAFAGVRNPVDYTASGLSAIASILRHLDDSPSVDLVVFVASLFSHESARDRLAALDGLENSDKPCVVFSHYAASPAGIEVARARRLPWFESQQAAARALRALVDYGEARQHHLESSQSEAARSEAAGRFPSAALDAAGGGSEVSVKAWLREAGIAVPAGALAVGADRATEIARSIGFPVAMKAQAIGLPHKSDVGGVRLRLHTEDEVRNAFDDLIMLAGNNPDALGWQGVLVEQMAEQGAEMMIGAIVDPTLGPFVVVGAGGIDAEINRDFAVAPAPLTPDEAQRLIRSLRMAPRFDGWRGAAALDLVALATTVAHVSELVADNVATIRELDLNPVVVYGEGLLVLDGLAILVGADGEPSRTAATLLDPHALGLS